ncbi:MAG TPA: phage tail sheath subtilisin-like domain-containing protein [Actinomycetota bacterium]|jgi:phage tail sheath protein FI|nr:phage tail sheath subtilisin-like domain-containing protein [Actinomycetota bacterium]
MPEYLTPGVYVEETSFRARSIEGVPTSTFGMAGRAQYGPAPYSLPGLGPGGGAGGPKPRPTLLTSYTEYERAFGGLTIDSEPCWLAFAARAFFSNGGRRLYVSRVVDLTMTAGPPPAVDVDANFASLPVPPPAPGGGAAPAPPLRFRARWPGSVARTIRVQVSLRRSKNRLINGVLTGVRPGAAVEVLPLPAAGTPFTPPPDTQDPDPATIQVVARNDQGEYGYRTAAGGFQAVDPATAAVHLVLAVSVSMGEDRVDAYNELELDEAHPRSIFTVLQLDDPPDEFSLVWLDREPVAAGQPAPTPGALVVALLSLRDGAYLTGGGDGVTPGPDRLIGEKADPDNLERPATGLWALGEQDDVAITGLPDVVDLSEAEQKTAVDGLLQHCTELRYRMAVVDSPRDSSIAEVRRFRAQFDSTYGALYYPWLRIIDPTRRPDPGGPPATIDVPPLGYVAGIYARTDVQRGVHKAPANEVVLGMDRFATNVTFDRQSVLNPEGVNALRFFEGRANRVWGARTMSSDPEWKYVNVRRLFIFLEHSIDKSTQWAVFEPNNERLWASIKQTIEDFLLTVWRTGALMGTRPEEAYFVRCDRTTMTQNDLDNGRLICLIGVAPTYPAEFVIFRIGQWTADARQS